MRQTCRQFTYDIVYVFVRQEAFTVNPDSSDAIPWQGRSTSDMARGMEVTMAAKSDDKIGGSRAQAAYRALRRAIIDQALQPGMKLRKHRIQ